MEDYTMNGPRLLSKGGKAVIGRSNENTGSTDGSTVSDELPVDPTTESQAAKETRPASSSTSSPVIRHITKYLWDDPGDTTKGMATIRIDCLPSVQADPSVTAPLVEWKEVPVDNVEARLSGEGLIVHVHSSQAHYVLNIPKLYGDVASVRAVVKPKRLLIQLTKKRMAVLSGIPTNNLDAWPQPHRTVR